MTAGPTAECARVAGQFLDSAQLFRRHPESAQPSLANFPTLTGLLASAYWPDTDWMCAPREADEADQDI